MGRLHGFIVFLVVVFFSLVPGSDALAKRLPAPDVKPFIYKDVKYVVPNANGRAGVVQAWDHKNETLLWEKKIYDVVINAKLEEDAQWVFIRDMVMVNDKLVIITEIDDYYALDVTTKKVALLKRRNPDNRRTISADGEPVAAPNGISACDKGECERVPVPVAAMVSNPGAPARIEGYLFRPKGDGPFPAVIALHGCGGLFTKQGKLAKRHKDWATRLKDLGYVVLFPDSFTARGVQEVCGARNREGLSSRERSFDAYAALKWLQAQTFIKPQRIGLLGWSNGGTTVLAAVDKTAAARNGTREDFKAAVALYPGCKALQKKDLWVPVIPTTILAGGADEWTPSAACVSLVDEAKKKGAQAEITIYQGAHHGFDAPDTPLHTKTDLAYSSRTDGTAVVGTDSAARDDAIRRVTELFERALTP